jgi:DNA-binding NarL/FixJ family response regulator
MGFLKELHRQHRGQAAEDVEVIPLDDVADRCGDDHLSKILRDLRPSHITLLRIAKRVDDDAVLSTNRPILRPPLAVVMKTLVRWLQHPYSTFDESRSLKGGFFRGFCTATCNHRGNFHRVVKGLHSKKEARNILRAQVSCEMMRRMAAPPINPREGAGLTEALQYRLVIADDHPLFRGALREAVAGLLEQVDIAEAGTYDELVELLERNGDVDLVLLDLAMPGVRGFSGLMYMRAQYPGVPVIVVSANDDPAAIRRCMDFGASGFIPKTLGVDAMRTAISRILGGDVWTPPDVDLTGEADAASAELMARMATLTPQQVRVLMMLSEGLLNKQIAFQLGVSEATVKAHVSAILQKLGVESRTQAVIAAAKIEAGQWPQGIAAEG